MINLCLVVIATQFSETKKREIERMAAERARRRRQSRSSSTATSVQNSTAGCYDELLEFVSYLGRFFCATNCDIAAKRLYYTGIKYAE